MVLNDALTTS